MPEFITNAEKVNRSISLELPEVMKVETLADLVALCGEDLVLSKTKGALQIMLRSIVRGKLEAKDELKDGEEEAAFTFSDDDIKGKWDLKWIPELRVQKTAEEKALEVLQGLDPETMASVLKAFKAQKKATAE